MQDHLASAPTHVEAKIPRIRSRGDQGYVNPATEYHMYGAGVGIVGFVREIAVVGVSGCNDTRHGRDRKGGRGYEVLVEEKVSKKRCKPGSSAAKFHSTNRWLSLGLAGMGYCVG